MLEKKTFGEPKACNRSGVYVHKPYKVEPG